MRGIVYICEVGVIALDQEYGIISSWRYPEEHECETFEGLKRGRLPSELRRFLSDLSKSGVDTIIITEEDLQEGLSREGFKVEKASDAVLGELRRLKLDLLVKSGLAVSEGDAKEKLRAFALAMSEQRLKEFFAKPDLHAIQAIQTLDEVNKALNLLATRVRGWYGLHFPELDSLIDDPSSYARIMSEFGRKEKITQERLEKMGLSPKKVEAILTAVKESKGGDIRDEDLMEVSALARQIIELSSMRERLLRHLEKGMEDVAPNLTAVAGATIGARLMAKVGSLEKLALLPASTIQVLGAEKALFRALRTGVKPPKHGFLFQHQAVHSAPKWQRGKIARSLATKIAIASRIDAFRGGREREVEEKLRKRLEEIRVKYSKPPDRERTSMKVKRRRGRRRR